MFQSSPTCPNLNCGAKVKKGAAFCPECGTDLQQRQAKISQNRWFARDDEFAAAFSIDDLDGFFAKSPLEVESGQQALIFQDGQFQGILEQGSYSFETFLGVLNRLGRHKNVRGILLRTAEMPLDLTVSGLPTQENLSIEAEITLGIRIGDPALFAQLMTGKSAYTLTNLRLLLAPQVRQILSEYTRGSSIRSLNTDPQLRLQLTQCLKQQLDDYLLNNGLTLGQVQTLTVSHTRYDQNMQIRGSAWLDADKLRLQREHRQQLDSLYSEEEWRKIARMETEQQIENKIRDLKFQGDESEFVDRLRRIDLLEKIRNADSREALIEHNAHEILANLEHETLDKHLLRENQVLEWRQVQALAQIKLETERSTAKIEQDRIIRFARMQLEQDQKIAELKHQINIAQTTQNEQQRHQLSDLQHQLQQQQLQGEAQLAEKKRELALHAEDMIKREREVEFERAQTWKDAVQAQSVKRDELDTQAQENDVINQNMADKIELWKTYKQAKTEFKQTLREEDRKDQALAGQLKIERIEALGKVNPQTLIALSDREQGELIAGLQRTEAMKNMTAEQIMALAAENSPQVAQALQERYRHANDQAISERERGLFEKLADQSKNEADRAERQSTEAQRNLLNMAATLTNNPQASPNVFVTPGAPVSATPFQATPTSSADKVMVCSQCGAENELNSRFCDKCGQKLG